MSETLSGRLFERDPSKGDEKSQGYHEQLTPEKPRVLIADDEAGLRLLLRMTLAEVADVEAYNSGEDILSRIKDQTRPVPDIVLLDNNMGAGLTGLETAKTITEFLEAKGGRLPHILLVTARHEGITSGQLDECGVSRIITKPFNPTAVTKIVQQIHQARKAPPKQ